MLSKMVDAVGNIFHIDEKENEAERKKTADLQQKANNVFGVTEKKKNNTLNPFLNKNGELINPYLDYDALLKNPNVSEKAKEFMRNATGTSSFQSNDYLSQVTGSTTKPNTDSTKTSGNKLGFISAKYETGGYDGGKVSSGSGDYGGISYGIPQFSTTTGSADSFVKWLKQSNPEMGKYFGNSRAGTTEFSDAWKQVYAKYGDDFSNIQASYAFDNFVKPLANLAKQKTGVDYTRSDALKELIFSTAIQFGSGSTGLSALGNVNSNMSDADIINASYDKKISNYKNFFRSSSSAVQESVRNRFVNERNDVLALVGKNNSSVQNTANASGNATILNSTSNVFNPFLNKNGELINPYLDYDALLKNPNVPQIVKNQIAQATGKTIRSDSGVAEIQSSKSNNSIADAAQKYMGTPYVWGGESMAEGGMDCSGFVYNALKDAGYDVGRTTAQGYRNYGTKVSKSDMQPGDLIFFGKNNNDASHIGIYIGNGQMIHSSGGSRNTKSNPGKGVSITNVDYRSDFLEARRY